MFQSILSRYEAFLRIDQGSRPWDLMRARAVYVVAWLFAFLQFLNLFAMSHSYGRWTLDHTASVIAILSFISIAMLLRWTKAFPFFAICFGSFSLLCLALSSKTAGIHSALLPFIVVGPMMAAFIAGWRIAILFGLISFGVLCLFLQISMSAPTGIPEWTEARMQQRFVQASFALVLGSVMSALLSASCQQAFEKMEKAVDEANKAARAKSDFLATMSHELRTPMNGVLGLTEALLSEASGPLRPRQEELLGHVRGSGEHLLRLLNDLLDLAKVEAGKLLIDPRPFALANLVETVRQTYAETASGKGLTVTVSLDPELPGHVRGDDMRLRQILGNLLGNAIKFTGSGTVCLDVRRGGGDTVLFRVSDTGKGIPSGLHDTIFQPFEQGEKGITRYFGGTGLGLPICKKICSQMNGSIVLERSGPEGSCFLVALPLPACAGGSRAQPGREPNPGGYEGLRVLAAEDNEVNRLVLGEFLKAWGVRTVFAHDGREALELFEEEAFDLLLLDRRMPVMDGEAVIRAIRARSDRKASIPIIAATADAMEADRSQMIGIGADGFISKPLRPERLKAVMAEVLARAPSARNGGERTG